MNNKIEEPCSPEKMGELKEAFEQFDIENKGIISISKLSNLCKFVGYNISEQELHEKLKHSTEITYEEFLYFIIQKSVESKYPAAAGELFEALRVFDRDKDGLISLPDCKYVLMNIPKFANMFDVQGIMGILNTFQHLIHGKLYYKELVAYFYGNLS